MKSQSREIAQHAGLCSPSPLNGERAGVRGGNVTLPHEVRNAFGVITPHPQSLSPLRGEGSKEVRVQFSSRCSLSLVRFAHLLTAAKAQFARTTGTNSRARGNLISAWSFRSCSPHGFTFAESFDCGNKRMLAAAFDDLKSRASSVGGSRYSSRSSRRCIRGDAFCSRRT